MGAVACRTAGGSGLAPRSISAPATARIRSLWAVVSRAGASGTVAACASDLCFATAGLGHFSEALWGALSVMLQHQELLPGGRREGCVGLCQGTTRKHRDTHSGFAKCYHLCNPWGVIRTMVLPGLCKVEPRVLPLGLYQEFLLPEDPHVLPRM